MRDRPKPAADGTELPLGPLGGIRLTVRRLIAADSVGYLYEVEDRATGEATRLLEILPYWLGTDDLQEVGAQALQRYRGLIGDLDPASLLYDATGTAHLIPPAEAEGGPADLLAAAAMPAGASPPAARPPPLANGDVLEAGNRSIAVDRMIGADAAGYVYRGWDAKAGEAVLAVELLPDGTPTRRREAFAQGPVGWVQGYMTAVEAFVAAARLRQEDVTFGFASDGQAVVILPADAAVGSPRDLGPWPFAGAPGDPGRGRIDGFAFARDFWGDVARWVAGHGGWRMILPLGLLPFALAWLLTEFWMVGFVPLISFATAQWLAYLDRDGEWRPLVFAIHLLFVAQMAALFGELAWIVVDPCRNFESALTPAMCWLGTQRAWTALVDDGLSRPSWSLMLGPLFVLPGPLLVALLKRLIAASLPSGRMLTRPLPDGQLFRVKLAALALSYPSFLWLIAEVADRDSLIQLAIYSARSRAAAEFVFVFPMNRLFHFVAGPLDVLNTGLLLSGLIAGIVLSYVVTLFFWRRLDGYAGVALFALLYAGAGRFLLTPEMIDDMIPGPGLLPLLPVMAVLAPLPFVGGAIVLWWGRQAAVWLWRQAFGRWV